LQRCAGTQFDTTVVRAFQDVLNDEALLKELEGLGIS